MCWRKEKAWILLSFSASVYEGYILSSDVYSVACVSGLGDHVATSGCSSLSESFRGIFFEPTTVENPRFVVGISTLSIIVPKTEVLLLPVWAVILLFPVVGCCRNHSGPLSFVELGVIENLPVAVLNDHIICFSTYLFDPQAQHVCIIIEAQYEG